MRFAEYSFEYDKLVVGSSLQSLIYAFCKNLPLVFSRFKTPCYIDFFDPDVSLAYLGLDNQTMSLRTEGENKIVGSSKVEAWKHLMFFLSLSGNIPMMDKTAAIRLEDENTLKATTDSSRFARFKFNELIVFDEDIAGLPDTLIQRAEKKYKVVDWMHIASGKQQAIDYFKTDDEFVNEIHLYPADGIDGNNFSTKDVVTISYLTEDQLKEFEYSDTYARFKATKIFKNAGFRGRRNGRSVKNPKLYKHYAFKMETTKREFFKLNRDKHKNIKNIEFNYQPLEDLLKLKPLADAQPQYLLNKILKK
tara:strand:+ start:176 stop:1093 length:918 start_codon:yes stop_codon:yes gene_type:complete